MSRKIWDTWSPCFFPVVLYKQMAGNLDKIIPLLCLQRLPLIACLSYFSQASTPTSIPCFAHYPLATLTTFQFSNIFYTWCSGLSTHVPCLETCAAASSPGPSVSHAVAVPCTSPPCHHSLLLPHVLLFHRACHSLDLDIYLWLYLMSQLTVWLRRLARQYNSSYAQTLTICLVYSRFPVSVYEWMMCGWT